MRRREARISVADARAIAVEMRAAALVASFIDEPRPIEDVLTARERRGWVHHRGDAADPSIDPLSFEVGWLAREIWTWEDPGDAADAQPRPPTCIHTDAVLCHRCGEDEHPHNVPRHADVTEDGEDDGARVCCSVCGGLQVEYAIWYDPNADQTGEPFGSWNAGDNTFCADCDTEGRDPNPDLVDAGAEPERFAALRKRRREKDAWDAEHAAGERGA